MMDGQGRSPRRGQPGRVIRKRVGGKSYVYLTRHAMNRMKQRRIAESEVMRTIDSPDQTGLPVPKFRSRKRNMWYRSDRTAVHVIFEEMDDHIRVITVYDVTVDDSTGEDSKALRRRRARQRKPQRRGKR